MASTMTRRRFKELRQCLRCLESFTDGQARVVDYDEDSMNDVLFELEPNDGLYKDGKYMFEVTMENWGDEAPTVRCITDIYHPNIERYSSSGSTNICLNLFDEWNPDFGLQDIVQGLLFLLHNPEPEDPLLSGFDAEHFEENVAKQRAGEDIEGCDKGDHEDSISGRPLPDEVATTEVIVGQVEAALASLVLEGACGEEEEEDVKRDVAGGACAASAAHEEGKSENVSTTSPSVEEAGTETVTDNTDVVTEGLSLDPVTPPCGEADSQATNAEVQPEVPSPEVNSDTAPTPLKDDEENAAAVEDDRTSTDSGVDCVATDTEDVTTDVTDPSPRDSYASHLARAYRRSQSLPNRPNSETGYCDCDPYVSAVTKAISTYANDTLNAIHLIMTYNESAGGDVLTKTAPRTPADATTATTTEPAESPCSSASVDLTEETPKTKWWVRCFFPWLAKSNAK